MLPDNLSVLAAVTGMVVLTVLAASLVSVYQRHLELKRQRIHRLLWGAQRAERLLAELAAISLPRDIRVLLRRDIIARYRGIARMHSAYPGITQVVSQAEQRLSAEGGDVGQVLPVPADDEVFEQWQMAIGELYELLQPGRLVTPLAAENRAELRAQLLERQAECLFGHFMHQADLLKQQDRELAARKRISQLLEMLTAQGLHSVRVQDLHRQADAAYQYLVYGPPEDAGQAEAGQPA